MEKKQNRKNIFHPLDGNFLVWQIMMLDGPYELMNCPPWNSIDLEIEFLTCSGLGNKVWECHNFTSDFACCWNMLRPTRLPPTSYKWSFNHHKWPYKMVTEVITLLVGVITPFIAGWGLPCKTPCPKLTILDSFSIYWHLHTQFGGRLVHKFETPATSTKHTSPRGAMAKGTTKWSFSAATSILHFFTGKTATCRMIGCPSNIAKLLFWNCIFSQGRPQSMALF